MDNADIVTQIKQKLAKYNPSDEAKDTLSKAKIVLMVGITGAGKQRIIAELLETNEYYFIVSHTTRSARVNSGVPERDGVEYFFIDNNKLLRMLENGEFVECKFIHNQQFSGTSIKEIQSAMAENKIAITDIDVQGVEEYMRLKPDTKAVFVLPPSYEVWEERFRNRGEVAGADRNNRYISAAIEIEAALKAGYYHFVVNDELGAAVSEIDSIAHGKSDPKLDSSSEQLAKSLLQELKKRT